MHVLNMPTLAQYLKEKRSSDPKFGQRQFFFNCDCKNKKLKKCIIFKQLAIGENPEKIIRKAKCSKVYFNACKREWENRNERPIFNN